MRLSRNCSRAINVVQCSPNDLTNLTFLGSKEELITAFGKAGWIGADNLSVGSALKVAQATVRNTGYLEGPVSLLLLHVRAPDLALQKSLNVCKAPSHSYLEDEPALH